MALVEHEVDVGLLAQTAVAGHLVHDPEELERVGGPRHQVVVRVEAGVEVERAELPLAQEERDDELDVGARCEMSRVDDDAWYMNRFIRYVR